MIAYRYNYSLSSTKTPKKWQNDPKAKKTQQKDLSGCVCYNFFEELRNMMEETTLLSGRYKLLNPIGSGGMAVVYKALDEMLERTVSVKILREDYSNDSDFANVSGRKPKRQPIYRIRISSQYTISALMMTRSLSFLSLSMART
jgi:hypothetical protein